MTFELEGKPKGQQIRELFRQYGTMETLRRFTERCIHMGLFDPVQLEGFQIVGAMKTVKDAIKEKGEDGLPFAYCVGKRGGDSEVWKVQETLDYNDACTVLQESYIDKITEHYAEMVSFHKWMRRRFGHAPSIPVLEM